MNHGAWRRVTSKTALLAIGKRGFRTFGGSDDNHTDTSEAELLTWLQECSRYPQSPQRTASVDVLLDLLLEWAGQP